MMTETNTKGIEKGSNSKENEYKNNSKWVVKDYSDIEASRIDEVTQKQKIRETIIEALDKSLENAEKMINEYSLPKFKQIFSLTKNNKTQIILRYGPSIFYHGIIDDEIVADKEKNSLINKSDVFEGKKFVLNDLKNKINDDKWFEEYYERFEKKRNEAKSKAQKTRDQNKVLKKKMAKKIEKKTPELEVESKVS